MQKRICSMTHYPILLYPHENDTFLIWRVCIASCFPNKIMYLKGRQPQLHSNFLHGQHCDVTCIFSTSWATDVCNNWHATSARTPGPMSEPNLPRWHLAVIKTWWALAAAKTRDSEPGTIYFRHSVISCSIQLNMWAKYDHRSCKYIHGALHFL